jgi:hypothetical protein
MASKFRTSPIPTMNGGSANELEEFDENSRLKQIATTGGKSHELIAASRGNKSKLRPSTQINAGVCATIGPFFVLMVILALVGVAFRSSSLGIEENDIQHTEDKREDSYLKFESDDGTDDEDNVDISKDSAPRTNPNLTYNEIKCDGKYFLYTPSGGMSNQVMELRNALLMAQHLRRTLYVPMIGRHSNMVYGYDALPLKFLFSSDRIFDFPRMGEFVDVIPLNITLKKMVSRFIKVCGKNSVKLVINIHARQEWTDKEMLNHITDHSHALVFLEAGGYWAPFFPSGRMNDVKRFIAYSRFLRDLSMKIAAETLGNEFYAIHGRLGDYASEWGGHTSKQAFVDTPQFHRWNKKLPCYLASDQPDSPFFAELKKHVKVVTIKDLQIEGFLSLFPSERTMRMDMAGVLDKLICSQALDFLGSSFSTFTHEILYIRTHSKYVFPERYARKHNVTLSV